MSKLAILGGEASLTGDLKTYITVGENEREAVSRVIDSGLLSGFYGSWSEEFWGGPHILAFEQAWKERFGCKHAVSINSNTSGLMAAMGAIGISPGDEVILPPYTMSATAMAPLIYGGIPVFVDIDETYFCLDPTLVEQAINPRTKAIIVTNLFGHPAQLTKLRELADMHEIYLIEDNAQAPTAMEDGKYAGTIGHIGVFSLNCHKHIQTGEGGVCTTNDDHLALRMQMIRNHGENVVEDTKVEDLTNLVCFNLRMTELSAAVGIEQLARTDVLIGDRVNLAQQLSAGTSGLDGLTPPQVRQGCSHIYYIWALKYDEQITNVSRQKFVEALNAEGVKVAAGYLNPLYKLPLFQKQTAIGNKGFPFNLSNQDYANLSCPVVESMQSEKLIMFETCAYDYSDNQKKQIVDAVHKVYENCHELMDQ